MSLITRCPACTTLFKVVPDQLRVSEGWVRCGQCDEVFDATAQLQGDGAVQRAAVAQNLPLSTTVEEPLKPDIDSSIEEPSGLDTEPQIPSDPAPHLEQELAAQLDWPEEPLPANVDIVMDARPGAAFEPDPALYLELPGEPAMAAIPQDPQLSESEEWSTLHTEVPIQPRVTLALPEPEEILVEPHSIPEPTSVFVPTFTRTELRVQRPWVRRVLIAATLLLVAGLAGQVVWYERDRLAAHVPDLRPVLTALCTELNCQINPFKQIETVVIDNSSFVKIRGDVYRLDVTLKNTALVDVAAPAVELTLTDSQDQPLIRHVLSAAALGAQGGTLAAGDDLTTALPIHVKSLGTSDRISGYRLLAFYP